MTGDETGDNRRYQKRPPSPADDAVQPVPVGGHPGVHTGLVGPPAPVTPAGYIYIMIDMLLHDPRT